MRVGLIIYGSLDTLSGGYLYDRILVEHLRAAGDTVEVISLPVVGYGQALGQNYSRTIRNRLAGLHVDLLLQDELNHPSLFVLNRWLRQVLSAPFIGVIHHLRSSESPNRLLRVLYRAIERRYLESLDGYVFNSQSSRQAVNVLAPHQKPFVVATPGGDVLQESAFGSQNNAYSQVIQPDSQRQGIEILFVGNLIERKGLHTLLSALARVNFTDWRLRVVGRDDVEPAYVRRCRNLVTSADLENQVEFLGALNDGNLVQAYRTSQLLAVPSTFEGFGIVYLEAMRWGVVPIAGKAGGSSEIIQNGINGWLVPPGDEAVLAAVIETISRNPEILQPMSRAARKRYAEFPTWRQTTENIRQFMLAQL